MNKIRVLIADDHSIVRAGIHSLLDSYPDIEVVGEASSGAEAIEKALRLEPDVVLMDIAMRDLSGLEATAEIRERAPRVNVLALTMHDREEYFFAMLKAGALGYVLKESEPAELIAAIRAVYRGEALLSPIVTKAVLEDYLSQQTENTASGYDCLSLRKRSAAPDRRGQNHARDGRDAAPQPQNRGKASRQHDAQIGAAKPARID